MPKGWHYQASQPLIISYHETIPETEQLDLASSVVSWAENKGFKSITKHNRSWVTIQVMPAHHFAKKMATKLKLGAKMRELTKDPRVQNAIAQLVAKGYTAEEIKSKLSQVGGE